MMAANVAAKRIALNGRRWLWLLALSLTGLALPVHAQVPAAPTTGDAVSFHVRVIEAQKGAPQVDPRLADLERELRVLHRDYTRFALVGTETLKLTVNQRGAVHLPKGELAIQYLGPSGDKAQRVRHRVEMPGLNATVRSIAPGGRTLDVLQVGEKLVIVATTVGH